MIGAVRIVQRNALVYRRIWRGSVFFNFLQPTLFLLAMGVGVGSFVNRGEPELGGVDFLHFLAPGLLAAICMQAAAFESSFPITGKMTWHRNYEAITATPMRIVDIVLGELAWIGVRMVTIATAFTIIMVSFGLPSSPMLLLAIPAAVLTGIAFSAVIMSYSATLKTGASFNELFRFVITPLFLFSGVFFPISRLPDFLERLAWLTPLFHGVELTRGFARDTVPDTWPIHTGYLLAMLTAGIVLSLQTFRRKLHA